MSKVLDAIRAREQAKLRPVPEPPPKKARTKKSAPVVVEPVPEEVAAEPAEEPVG